jgi:hypothetical protein
MIETTVLTWVIALFGAITFFPLFGAQLIMLFNPKGQKAKDLIIGKGADWRDRTHFKSALAFAWADIIIILPLFILGTVLVLNGQQWGYIIWLSLGVLSIYFSILFWVMEKEYTYKLVGWLAYYTYFWGFFLYWGMGAIVYSIMQITNQ